MTEWSGIWEVGGGGDESPHSVAQWGAVEAAIAGVASANEGVLPRVLNELAPSTQAGATQIRIASGWAIVDGHPYHNDGNEDFTPVTPSGGTTGRRAVLRADWGAQTVRIVEISSADGTATIPALTQTAGTTYEIPLCQYTVTTGGAIGAFVDEREFAGGERWREIVKAADESMTSSTTLQDDDDFQVTLKPNTDYLVECFLTVQSPAAADWKFAWTLTGMTWDGVWTDTLLALTPGAITSKAAYGQASATSAAVLGNGNSLNAPWRAWFVIHAGTTGGILKFQWAQNTSDGSTTAVKENSYMRYRELGAS